MPYICPSCGIEPYNFSQERAGYARGIVVFECAEGIDYLDITRNDMEGFGGWECSNCNSTSELSPEELWHE